MTPAMPEDDHARGPVDVYEYLRNEILAGRLMPNERLVEADIALALNTGRSHVRTALARLQQEAVVVRTPHRGARVRMIGQDEAIEILSTRGVLEGLTARYAAANVTPDEGAELRQLIQDMKSKLDAGDLLGYSAINPSFHKRIIEISRHTTATRLISGLQAQMVRYQYRTILVPGRAPHSVAEHEAIAEAIAERREADAENMMRVHLMQTTEALKQVPAVSFLVSFMFVQPPSSMAGADRSAG